MLKAIETKYKGYRFRSRLEWRWAVFFDTLGVPWEYEKEGYNLGDAGWYLPDFWLPREQCWVEIKPDIKDSPPALKIYLAGKVRPNWREDLDTKGHEITGPDLARKDAHSPGLHNSNEPEDNPRPAIITSCLDGIDKSDMVFAWIDSNDCHGTLVEIGYARAKGKRISVCFSSDLDLAATETGCYSHDSFFHDMWFAEAIATECIYSRTPQAGLNYFLPPPSKAEEKCAALSRENRCLLVHGNPYLNEHSITVFDHDRCWARGHHFEISPSIEKEQLQTFSSQWGYTITRSRLMKAYEAARSARSEHGEHS